ncbi:hypothetical protein NIES4075_37890 [Tolypothrix sp. NIES-4075]|uniref:hypothetical protein n=1 Tax=Tolypothrix sp. NIES-4075 TaxID=2005459 RepID=UPI000B5C9CC4|nr:hypothetical protein [Tolypothrix sp. NIES-4075]GAX42785.1 hypothetical protein NIES4075_37890 [Tolypothrix sp. NIES-4075]
MSSLCVSVAKNSTKLQRLLLYLRINSSTQFKIAKIIKQSPELKILKSLSKRLAFQHLGLIKNIANWWYFDAVVFPNKPSLFAAIPEALLAIQSLAQKYHEIAVYLTAGTLEGDIETERVTLQGKSKFATTYYPYFYSKNVRSRSASYAPTKLRFVASNLRFEGRVSFRNPSGIYGRSLCLIPQFSTLDTLSELTISIMS